MIINKTHTRTHTHTHAHIGSPLLPAGHEGSCLLSLLLNASAPLIAELRPMKKALVSLCNYMLDRRFEHSQHNCDANIDNILELFVLSGRSCSSLLHWKWTSHIPALLPNAFLDIVALKIVLIFLHG